MKKTSFLSTATLAITFGIVACGEAPVPTLSAEPQQAEPSLELLDEFGVVKADLSTPTVNLLANFDILPCTAAFPAPCAPTTTVMGEINSVGASPAVQTTDLPLTSVGSWYTMVLDGDIDCTYSGPRTDFIGCTLASITPDPFQVRAGDTISVQVAVNLIFQSGTGDPEIELHTFGGVSVSLTTTEQNVGSGCGAEGRSCTVGTEVCATVDSSNPAECWHVCDTLADCSQVPGTTCQDAAIENSAVYTTGVCM